MNARDGECQGCSTERAGGCEHRLERGGPEQDGCGEEDEGAPRLNNLATGVLDVLLRLGFFEAGCGGFTVDVLGLPLLHHERQCYQGQQRRDDVDQFGRAEQHQDSCLTAGEDDAGHECDQADFADAAHTVLDCDHQQRYESDEDLQYRNHACGQVCGVQAADLSCGGHGDTDSTVCAGCGVSYQRQHGCFERVEAQGYQQCSRDSDRDTEACRAFDEATEAEGNQQHLDALVVRDGGDGGTHDVEVTGAYGDAVEPHSHEHDPADGPCAREEAGEDGTGTCGDGQAEDGTTDDEGGAEGQQC